MNPDENQPQTAGPVPATPEASSAPATPAPAPENLSTADQADVASALDQLAADAVAAANDAAAAPAAEPAVAPVAPVAEVSAAEPTAAEPAAVPAAETPVATPAPDIAAAVTEMDADAVLDSIDSPETTPEHSIPSAIGVDAVASASEAASLAAENAPAEGGEAPESDAKIVSEDGAEEEPIQPADPVPGSIGSAINYSDTAPNHSEPTEKPKFSLFAQKPKAEEAPVAAESIQVNVNPAPAEEPRPDFPTSAPGSAIDQAKNKKNSMILALSIIGAVVLIGIIVLIIVLVVTSGQNKPTTTTTAVSTEEVETVDSSLVCSRTSTSMDVNNSSSNTLASYDLKMIANYTDDELTDISFTGTYNYTTEEAASEGARQARLNYIREYEKLGLKEDPFSSNYPVNGMSFSSTHFAEYDDLDEDNAAIFFLTVNSRGVVVTDKEAIRKIYVDRGYTCSGGEDAEEIDEEDVDTTTDSDDEDDDEDYEEYDEDIYYDEDDLDDLDDDEE